jgi:hypothetical protein
MLLLGLGPGAAPAFAGALPLFRHALRNLPAERFEVAVFHRGPLDEEEERLVNLLRDAPKAAGANIEVFSVDVVGQVEERLQSLWYSQTSAALPWVVVRPPNARTVSRSMWAGPLKTNLVALLLESPARRKITDGLLRGDAAVWVLLESGDVMRDEAAVDLLTSELKAMEKKLGPPTNSPAQVTSFSLVRVTRNDPAEELLIGGLTYGERTPRTKPTAYPVFGRGGVLPGMTGRHLNEESIREVCLSLTRPQTNGIGKKPERTLLLCANWDASPEVSMRVAAKSNAPAMLGSAGGAPADIPSGRSEGQVTVAIDEGTQTKTWIGFILLGCALGVVVGLYVLRGRRSL